MLYQPTVFISHPFKTQIFFPGVSAEGSLKFEPNNLKNTIEIGSKKMGFCQLVIPNLTHSSDVHHLKAASFKDTSNIVADSVIVDTPGVAVAITHADCQSTVIYDPRQKRFAAIHAGWRGLFKNIYSHTIDKMLSLGSRAEDLLVFLGPSLGLEHSAFENFKDEVPKEYHANMVLPYHFDLKTIAKEQFLSLGLLDQNIEISPVCTAENTNFCSYRRSKKQNGSLSARNFTICGILL